MMTILIIIIDEMFGQDVRFIVAYIAIHMYPVQINDGKLLAS